MMATAVGKRTDRHIFETNATASAKHRPESPAVLEAEMDRWAERWMDGWIDRWVDECVDGRMDC